METRKRALTLMYAQRPRAEISARLGVPVGTLGYWFHVHRAAAGTTPGRGRPNCPRCTGDPLDPRAYSYLLGLYLGDGHIVHKYRQHTLSVFLDLRYPGIIDSAEAAMKAVLTGAGTGRRIKKGCAEVKSYSQHWVCLFPQHGPGKKHERTIALEPWQQAIADDHPWELIRGLIQSDGCRITNWTVRTVAGKPRRYEYPRYFFTNTSDDIRRIYADALNRVGVEWKVTRKHGEPFNISVARKSSVALMDLHVGPKC